MIIISFISSTRAVQDFGSRIKVSLLSWKEKWLIVLLCDALSVSTSGLVSVRQGIPYAVTITIPMDHEYHTSNKILSVLIIAMYFHKPFCKNMIIGTVITVGEHDKLK